MPDITSIETVVVVEDAESDCYTEAYLLDDGRIRLHVEDGIKDAEPTYTLEQAEALHRALGHLLYLANQEA